MFWWCAGASAAVPLCQLLVFATNIALVAFTEASVDFRSTQRSPVHMTSCHDDCPCGADFCGGHGGMSSLIPGSAVSVAKPSELSVA